ncbi:HAMP domain-containing histidine kinase [Rhizobium skierniewicense]|uniref:sensor histidine kinase n=1 Tax=Rhizobium skierniewicense TaxID=984260 RepID=UPI001FADED8C|nr:HAMP domain-containing sensor histidine kinase [Rhizobium skierniewicense]MCI9868766.1 HAMP domain-containing histidine kinase [Rhizobium skierniewicense]
MRRFDFTIRLVSAFAVLAILIVSQGLLNRHIATEAEQQVVRGRYAGDILSGLLELSATKQRLRAWSLRALIGADHAPSDGEILRNHMAATIEQLQRISQETRRMDHLAGAPADDDDARDEALQLISGSVIALKPAIEDIRSHTGADDVRTAWASIEKVFDQGAGRDLREVLNDTIAKERSQLDITRANADAALLQLNRVLAVLTFIIAVIGMGLAYAIANAIRRPLQQMSEGARAYEAGRLEHRIPVTTTDEFGRFAASINRMASELLLRRNEEANHRTVLEQQVRERTCALENALSRLRASEGRRRSLLADISHELRTPTTAIRGEAEIALRGQKEDDDYRGSLARIGQAASQMGSLIDDLLMMSRGEDETLALNREPIDIAGPLEEALLSAAALANQRSVTITTDIEDAETIVAGDAFRLRQVIAILLDNAIRYSPHDGHVEVASSVIGNTWELIVRDHGIGIEPDAIDHVFDRNFRGNNARLHRPEGTGLGLSIAKHLISAHEGTITLSSDSDEGTTATLRLPLFRNGAVLESVAETKK